MIVKEIIEIDRKQFNHTYSDDGHVLRCGKIRYKDAVDPIDVDKYYFEDGVESIAEEIEEN